MFYDLCFVKIYQLFSLLVYASGSIHQSYLVVTFLNRLNFHMCLKRQMSSIKRESIPKNMQFHLRMLSEFLSKVGFSEIMVYGPVFFLYRLSHCKSLDVEDPIQAALSYREQLARFYLKYKVVTW